jgi:hypothetical protein
MEHHVDQIGVGVRQMVGDDDHRSAAQRRQMLGAVQR